MNNLRKEGHPIGYTQPKEGTTGWVDTMAIPSTVENKEAARQGLRLDDGFSFDNLVGVASSQVPELNRVEPGDPDNSYLVQKLEGTAAQGVQMPFGGPPLDQALIDDIRQWIADGANP